MGKASLFQTNFFKKLKHRNNPESEKTEQNQVKLIRRPGKSSMNLKNVNLSLHSYKIYPLKSSKNLTFRDLTRRLSFGNVNPDSLTKLNLDELRELYKEQKENRSLNDYSKFKESKKFSSDKKYIGSFFQRKLGKTFTFLKLGQGIQTEVYLLDVKKVLRKHTRTSTEIEFICEYLKSNKNIKSLIQPSEAALSHSTNKYKDELVSKIAKTLVFEQGYKDQIIFRYGDKADKFYIIIKGKVSVLILKEEEVQFSQNEFFFYLCLLSYYSEYELLRKCYESNYRSFFNFPYALELFLPPTKKGSIIPKAKPSIKGMIKLKIPDNKEIKSNYNNIETNNLGVNQLPFSIKVNNVQTDTPKVTETNIEVAAKPEVKPKPILKERKMSHYHSPIRMRKSKVIEMIEEPSNMNSKNILSPCKEEYKLTTSVRFQLSQELKDPPVMKKDSRKSLVSQNMSYQSNLLKSIEHSLTPLDTMHKNSESNINWPQDQPNKQLEECSNTDLIHNFNRSPLKPNIINMTRLEGSQSMIPKKKPIMNSKCYLLFKIYWMNILQKLIYRTTIEDYINRFNIDTSLSLIDQFPFIEEYALEKIKPQIDVINKFRTGKTKGGSFLVSPSKTCSNQQESVPFPVREDLKKLQKRPSGFVNNLSKRDIKVGVKIYKYYEVVTLSTGQKFGDVAFSLEKKRTATIIATEDTDMAILSKDNYLHLLKEFNDLIMKKNIQVLLNSMLFHSMTTAFMKKKHIINLFIMQISNRHEILLRENQEILSYLFIKAGSVELSFNKSLLELDETICRMGGKIDDGKLRIQQTNPIFLKHYSETKIKKRLIILQDSEYAGFEDMTIKQKNLITSTQAFREVFSHYDWTQIKYEKVDGTEDNMLNLVRFLCLDFEGGKYLIYV